MTISSDTNNASDFSRSTSFNQSWRRSDRDLNRPVSSCREAFVQRIQNSEDKDDEDRDDSEILLQTRVTDID